MNITRYEPVGLFEKFNEELGRLLGEYRRDGGLTEGDNSRVVTAHWAPAVDIKEESDRYLLLADVPGIDVKDIEITMEGGVLTIRGERSWEDTSEQAGFKRVERSRGTFYRRFSLPDTADPDKIAARGSNGVLEIVIPKREQAQPRRIQVKG